MNNPAEVVTPKVIPLNMDEQALHELVAKAEESDRLDHELTLKQAVHKYKKALFWAMFLSLTLVMEGYDVVVVSRPGRPYIACQTSTEWIRLDRFTVKPNSKKDSGRLDRMARSLFLVGVTGISRMCADVGEAAWQSGLSNSSVCGQIIGLGINAWTQDRFGCRPTLLVFLVFMICAIFVPVFAPSLPVLAFGEALCGVPWGAL
jgi:SP family general alpha glucoside:H+ symporter-like MFS transporter